MTDLLGFSESSGLSIFSSSPGLSPQASESSPQSSSFKTTDFLGFSKSEFVFLKLTKPPHIFFMICTFIFFIHEEFFI